jgi:50S ribosomal subunit-associated GTPase HflX
VGAPIIIALNKIDLIDTASRKNLQEYLEDIGIIEDHTIVAISVKEQKNIEELLQTIYDSLPHMVKITFQLPLEEHSQRFISQLYGKTKVLHITYGPVITVEVECNEKIKEKLIAASRTLKGKVL